MEKEVRPNGGGRELDGHKAGEDLCLANRLKVIGRIRHDNVLDRATEGSKGRRGDGKRKK